MQEKSQLSRDELLQLARVCVSFGDIERVIYLTGHRRENDAEHSWNLAIFAWQMLAKSNPRNLSLERVLRYALIHDLVEVYAGDTYFIDDAGAQTKHAREMEALQRLTAELKESCPDLVSDLVAYEERGDAEAAFVYALDKIIPIYVQIVAGAPAWRLEHISVEQIYDLKQHKVAVDEQVAAYFEDIMAYLRESPQLFAPEEYPAVKPGERYRHYKGQEYEIVTVAQHTEMNQSFVVYRSVIDGKSWARPLGTFGENVEVNGVSQPRFARLD